MPTADERKKHCLFVLAQVSFGDATKCLDYLVESGLSTNHPAYYGLIVAFCVLYGRPFTKNHGYGSLKDLIPIPSDMLATHKQVLDFRNQYYAHRQARPNHTGARETNHPILRILPPSQLIWIINDPVRNIEGLAEYRKLSSHMEKKCLYHTDKFNKKFKRDLSPDKLVPYRDYRLNCDDGHAFFT
jgi:hypothetical protein